MAVQPRRKTNVEMTVGLFVVLGVGALVYLSVVLGGTAWLEPPRYQVQAHFASVSGLRKGAAVEIAGVRVGDVTDIRLDPDDYEAVVSMRIQKNVPLQVDSIASIRTNGLIGDRFVSISPGGADELIEPGGTIEETESAIILEELISKYIFEKGDK